MQEQETNQGIRSVVEADHVHDFSESFILDRKIAGLKAMFHRERDRAVFLVLLDSEIRASELRSLDPTNLDLVGSSLFVRQGRERSRGGSSSEEEAEGACAGG